MTSQLTFTQAVEKVQRNLPEFVVPTAIQSVEEYQHQLDVAGKLKKALKQIETARDFYAKPHYNEYKRIRDAFEPYLKELEQQEKDFKKVLTQFCIEEDARRAKEQARIEAEALKNAANNPDAPVVVEDLGNMKTVETVNTKSQMRTVTKWKVIDESKIVRKYLMIDTKAIDAAVKAGITPAGIEVYEEKTMGIYT